MKVGLLSQWYEPETGGGAVPGVLARGLAARGHDVRVLTGFPNYPEGKLYPGYRQRWGHVERPDERLVVRRVPLYPSHSSRALGRAANYLSFGASAALRAGSWLADRDAFWVFNSPAPVGSVARQVARRRGVPYLLHVMDVWPDSVLESGILSRRLPKRVAGAVLDGVVRRTAEAAALVAVISPGQLDLLHERGVPREKLRYIPVWADEDLFFPRPADRSLLPAAARDADVVVMYAGAMGHVQRLDVAVRAVARAGPAVQLVMVGGGLAEQDLRALAADLGAGNVHFMGPRPASTMGDLSAAADLHLVSLADTPLMRVTMPSKIASIMAMGKPIIATCAGDAATVVERAGAGLAVDPGDDRRLVAALGDITRDPSQLAAWGEAARAFYLEELAREKAISRVEAALAEIADR